MSPLFSKYPNEQAWAIRRATQSDLAQCFEIESSLNERRLDAIARGFLLSGDSLESYTNYLDSGPFFVAEDGDRIIGFLFALSPSSKRLTSLKAKRELFALSDPTLLSRENVAWLAKVGVRTEKMGRGVASSLYEAVIASCPDWSFLTTTVSSPIRNLPSEKLQEKFGFYSVGELALGSRADLINIKCTVYFRPKAT